MSHPSAVVVGVGTFVVGLAIAIALFVVLGIEPLFLVGPAIAVGAGAYAAYRAAVEP
jgi:hypothetical protein